MAGNALGSDALAAIGLIAPFMSFSVFISGILSSGTVTKYSYHVGCFETRRALEYFSQGIFLSPIAGVAYTGLLVLFRNAIFSWIAPPGEIQRLAREYFGIMLLFFLLNPLMYVLAAMLVADGGEKLAAVANITSIALNIALSILFVGCWGIRGIAIATVLSRLIFLLILLAMAERFLGILAMFLGMALGAQPLIGTLNGEKNVKVLRDLMQAVCRDLTAISLLTCLFAPFLVRAFGINDATLLSQGIVALRIVSVTLVFQTLLVLFFALYYMIELELLAFTVSVFKSLVSPLVLTIVLSMVSKSPVGLFVGLAVAPVVSILTCAQAIFMRYGRERFPYMVPHDMDDRTFIYDFEVSPKNAVEMSRTADAQLQAFSAPDRIRMMVSVFIEDMLMLVLEKNPDRKNWRRRVRPSSSRTAFG